MKIPPNYPIRIKPYKVKKGKREAMEYDILVYEGKELVFFGSFVRNGKNLSAKDRAIFKAIKEAVEAIEG